MRIKCKAIPERHAWTAPRSNSAASSVLLKVASAAVGSVETCGDAALERARNHLFREKGDFVRFLVIRFSYLHNLYILIESAQNAHSNDDI